MSESHKPTVCLDFDGVMNAYTGWKGEDELFEPRKGLREFLIKLNELGYNITVHSTRSNKAILLWLDKHDLLFYVYGVSALKPKAIAYIDDRGIKFNGDYNEVLSLLSNFKTYWEK